MNRREFLGLRVMKYDDDFSVLELDEKFLMGENIIDQKVKDELTVVSYYEVVSKSKDTNNVSYITKIERLVEEN